MRGSLVTWALAAMLAGCGGSGGGSGGGGGSASDGAGASTGSSGDVFATARKTCLDTINADRATIGVPAYLEWTDAEACTDGQAQSDFESNTAHGAFGACGELAQDECPGWSGPPETMIGQCLAQMWAEGPGTDFNAHGHYINMSNPQYTKAACGFFVLPDGSVWATQNFQ